MVQTISPLLEERYKSAFDDYLRGGNESHLSEAYEIGHQAVEAGCSLVDLINIHCDALAARLANARTGDSMGVLAAAAGRMLLQATAAFTVLQVSQSENAAALRNLNALYEESANRFAHALHDDAAQMLSVAYLELSQLRSEVPASALDRVERLSGYLDQTCDQLRDLSHELRPPMLEHFGLAPALRQLARGLEQRYGISIILELADIPRENIRNAELTLYRAIHEALTNVVRHAHAQQAWVRLEFLNDIAECSIRDDGKGFDPDHYNNAESGIGLMNLRERITLCRGHLLIESTPGGGTCVRINLPLEK